jgi:hypothetical protein
MSDDLCKLHMTRGAERHCDGTSCMYWRLVDHLGHGEVDGCAIEHFEMLGDEKLVDWLISVKSRVDQRVGVPTR